MQLLQFFPDSDDVSTEKDSSSSGEKKDVTVVVRKDNEANAVLETAEITDDRSKDGNGQKKRKITDNTIDPKKDEEQNVEGEPDVKSDDNFEDKEKKYTEK